MTKVEFRKYILRVMNTDEFLDWNEIASRVYELLIAENQEINPDYFLVTKLKGHISTVAYENQDKIEKMYLPTKRVGYKLKAS